MARRGEPPSSQHYERLGRFIERYARAEAAFHLTFRFYSKMPVAEARLLFGGARVDDIIRHTKSLMALYDVKQPLIDDYEEIINHFTPIKDIRNKLIHWLLTFPEFPNPGFQMTNISAVKKINNMDTRIVTLSNLEEMGDDLMKIWTRLTYRHIRPNQAFDTSEPWRYKSP
jgi:hypothetical protein